MGNGVVAGRTPVDAPTINCHRPQHDADMHLREMQTCRAPRHTFLFEYSLVQGMQLLILMPELLRNGTEGQRCQSIGPALIDSVLQIH